MTTRNTQFPLWWWLIPLLILTTWLGARSLNADVIWVDEYHSLQDTGVSYFGPRGPAEIWVKLAERNPWHSPGYFMVLNVWYRFIGAEPAMLRALSLFFGLLTVAWTYRLGRDVVGKWTGLFGAIILGVSAFYVHFLHEMRIYTLFTLLTVFVVWIYLRIVSKPKAEWWAWAGLLIGCAALPYAHYYATLPIFALAIYHLLFIKKDRRWWYVVGVFVLAAVLFLPWISVFLSVFNRTQEFERLAPRALTTGDALVALVYYFSNGTYILLLALVSLAFFVKSKGARTLLFLMIALLALLLLTNLVLRIMHGGRIRYLIAMWPLLSLVVALGLVRLRHWNRWLATLTLTIWCGFGLANVLVTDITHGLDGSSYVFPLHIISNVMKVHQQPDDVIVNYLDDNDLDAIQYERIASFYYTPINLAYLIEQTPKTDREPWPEHMNRHIALLREHDRVWVAMMTNSMPTTFSEYESALLQSHQRCDLPFAYSGVTLFLYVADPALCTF